MMVLIDELHNRIRIASLIFYTKNLKTEFYMESLEANFHKALDIKYAISDGIMWAVFIHPLKELSTK